VSCCNFAILPGCAKAEYFEGALYLWNGLYKLQFNEMIKSKQPR
uniref:Uncharacterized protein n=1 Tax=Caenorhabditis japonica TaxID=281687 RepID=A0A8R1IDU8_CAEJA